MNHNLSAKKRLKNSKNSNRMYKDNPDYHLKGTFTVSGIEYNIYTPSNISTGYSMQRFVEAEAQNIYSASGATKDVIRQIAEAGIKICEEGTKANIRTDTSALWNNLLYRLKYPVDEHCGIRMGAILSFMEYTDSEGVLHSEPEQEIQYVWRKKKEDIAYQNDDAYAFFLSWGVSNTEAYREYWATLEDEEYFERRQRAIASLSTQKAFRI